MCHIFWVHIPPLPLSLLPLCIPQEDHWLQQLTLSRRKWFQEDHKKPHLSWQLILAFTFYFWWAVESIFCKSYVTHGFSYHLYFSDAYLLYFLVLHREIPSKTNVLFRARLGGRFLFFISFEWYVLSNCYKGFISLEIRSSFPQSPCVLADDSWKTMEVSKGVGFDISVWGMNYRSD